MTTDSERRGVGQQRKRGGARRLIAGLRITRQGEALLGVVRPFLPEAVSEGDLAYRLWRRGLELTLAEVVGLGVAPPTGVAEDTLAGLVAQRLLLCMPLLQRTDKLVFLGIDLGLAVPQPSYAPPPAAVENGMRFSYSTGPVEGNINRLKLIKRSGYGRAGFDLLRIRVLAS